MADPTLRSALECGAARAYSARARARCTRRRITAAVAVLAMVALLTRTVLWLVL
jgi:hypothetical protein